MIIAQLGMEFLTLIVPTLGFHSYCFQIHFALFLHFSLYPVRVYFVKCYHFSQVWISELNQCTCCATVAVGIFYHNQ